MNNKLLIVNDVTTYGRVSTFAMYPLLASYGIHPYFLPTAVVSNTLDYGTAEILDTSEWMKRTIDTWSQLGFHFDVIATGLINSSDQIETISALIKEQAPSLVIVDPIMADSGELYPGMYDHVIECNRRLCSKADIILPNITEACMLSRQFKYKPCLDEHDNAVLLENLYELGCKSIVVKGCTDTEGRKYNLVSEGSSLSYFKEYYDELPTAFIGTGDVFSAVFIAEILSESNIIDAVNNAASVVRAIIIDNADNNDRYDLDIETYIKEKRN